MLPLLLVLSIETVRAWVQESGFWGGVAIVFALLFACGLGLPLPEDIPLIVAGAFLVHDTRSWIIVGSAAWLGIIGGDCCLYFLSRRYGMNITRVKYIGKHVTAERIGKVQGLFERYGVTVVAVGRLFAGVRGAMVITAGTIKYNFAKFLIADGLAAIVSGGLFMLLGHRIGKSLNDQLIREFKHWFIAGAAVLAVGVVAWIVWRRRAGASVAERIEHRLEDKLTPHTGRDRSNPA